MAMLVYNFPSKQLALSFEWHWQHPRESLKLRGVVDAIGIGVESKRGGVGGIKSVSAKIAIVMTMLKFAPLSPNNWHSSKT
jgi:hypothetical protein